jgi:hypothetical protein
MNMDPHPQQHRWTARELAAEELESRGDGGETREPPAPARTYQVPRRFGLGSVLVVTAFFCVLFGAMRYWIPPLAMAYIGLQILAAGVMQMVMRDQPRGGSALAGAILLPTFVISSMVYVGRGYPQEPAELVMSIVCSAVGGGLLGYTAGVLIAAVFMLMQMADEMISRGKTDDRETRSPRDPNAKT